MHALNVRIAVCASLCLCFLACGGGGGGGGGGTGGGAGVTVTPSTVTVGPNGRVVFAAVSGGSLANVSWSADTGSIAPNSQGLATYTAPNGAATATVTASLVANPSKTDTSTVTVQAGLATATGRVISGGSGNGIANVVVEFRDGSAAVVGTATTNFAGYFSAGLPTTATRFHLRSASIPSSFYKQYTYDSFRYAATISTCSAPLPALSVGVSTSLNTTIVLPPSTEPPPPPPNGC